MTVMLAATAAALFGIGTYLLLQRKLSRIIIGLGLLTHGANVLLITAGRRGNPPIIGDGDEVDVRRSDAPGARAHRHRHHLRRHHPAARPRLPQLAPHRDDEVQDDVGDRAVGRSDVVHDEVADQEQVIAREEAP